MALASSISCNRAQDSGKAAHRDVPSDHLHSDRADSASVVFDNHSVPSPPDRSWRMMAPHYSAGLYPLTAAGESPHILPNRPLSIWLLPPTYSPGT